MAFIITNDNAWRMQGMMALPGSWSPDPPYEGSLDEVAGCST